MIFRQAAQLRKPAWMVCVYIKNFFAKVRWFGMFGQLLSDDQRPAVRDQLRKSFFDWTTFENSGQDVADFFFWTGWFGRKPVCDPESIAVPFPLQKFSVETRHYFDSIGELFIKTIYSLEH